MGGGGGRGGGRSVSDSPDKADQMKIKEKTIENPAASATQTNRTGEMWPHKSSSFVFNGRGSAGQSKQQKLFNDLFSQNGPLASMPLYPKLACLYLVHSSISNLPLTISSMRILTRYGVILHFFAIIVNGHVAAHQEYGTNSIP